LWDQRYNREDYVYGTEPNDFLRQHVTSLPAGRVLCLAEGEGRNAVFLAQQGFQVTAVDASSVGLQKAQRLARQRGVDIETVHADLANFVIEPQRWDAIVSIFCHVSPSIREMLHRQVVMGLREGGVLLLEAYTPKQIEYGTGGPPVPELTMQLSDLKQELAGLQFDHGVELDREVVEGEFHTGIGAVVQVLAIK
jgi:SAM-dependent methyltransferase